VGTGVEVAGSLRGRIGKTICRAAPKFLVPPVSAGFRFERFQGNFEATIWYSKKLDKSHDAMRKNAYRDPRAPKATL
jgi:hypothetical protein